jgi:hypothetical protein
MKRYIFLLLMFVMLAQPKLAIVDRVKVDKTGVMIVGSIPCHSVVYSTEKVNKRNELHVMVYYKYSPDRLKGCSLGGQRYTLKVNVAGTSEIYVNGIRR